jgi:hypothetical protein
MRPFMRRRRGEAAEAPPPVDPNTIWFERTEGTRRNPLVFKTKGRGLHHTLVPLYGIMDERYSVYLRNVTSQPPATKTT